MSAFLVYVTTANEAEAELIAQAAVEERLAACANLHGSVKSVYWWEGKVCTGTEVLLILKTSAGRKTELIDRVKELHSYDCPCVACLPIVDGNPGFLDWIESETN